MAQREEERHPNIVVGVDFGMTCTGVAYTVGPEWGPPTTMQHWPGKLLSELANKVPTSLLYADDGTTVKEWGFGCDGAESPNVKEFLKLHLARQDLSEAGVISQQDARRWFQDYITCIYNHVTAHLSATIPGYHRMEVEFLFSVPTTWKDVRVIEEIRAMIEKAIERGSPNHWACIGLTEAEAAAVYACSDYYQTSDIVLVCDSGGGTTDVNLLRLASAHGEPLRLEQLGNVEGRPIGSVFIDRAIHKVIVERLSKVEDHLTQSLNHIAWKMLAGRFQRLKCAFGTEATRTPSISLEVPYLKDSGADLPIAGIYDGQMRIQWDYIKHAFDVKIGEMCSLLDEQIKQMSTKYSKSRISYLVLSGGFGSSPYLGQCLHQRYAVRHNDLANQPSQLAVVHGLLLDRIQQLKQGVVMFESRCPPVSYGIVCDLIYDPTKHVGERVRRDPRDNNLYAVDQIEWLVLKGHAVPHTGIRKDFQLKTIAGEEHLPWKVQVVMSANAPDQLPQSLAGRGVEHVCNLDICSSDIDRKLKNRRWYNKGPRYWRATFDVKVVVGAADLSFQLWSKDQKIQSNEHKPIKVQWMPATTASADCSLASSIGS